MFKDGLDDNGGIFRRPLATVVPVNVGDAKSRGVTHAPFQVTARGAQMSVRFEMKGGYASSLTHSKSDQPKYPAMSMPSSLTAFAMASR